MTGATLGGIALIGLGLVFIFGRDFMWQLTKFDNALEGEKSERTDAWEVKTIFGGIVFIAIGIGVVLWALD
ncbi:MAG: hypothetical protein ACRDJH_11940 [Thermomicrobiales bacterium]